MKNFNFACTLKQNVAIPPMKSEMQQLTLNELSNIEGVVGCILPFSMVCSR